MTDLMMLGLFIFGISLLIITLQFRVYLTSIISIPFWLYMTIAFSDYGLLVVVFISMIILNLYLTIILIRA